VCSLSTLSLQALPARGQGVSTCCNKEMQNTSCVQRLLLTLSAAYTVGVGLDKSNQPHGAVWTVAVDSQVKPHPFVSCSRDSQAFKLGKQGELRGLPVADCGRHDTAPFDVRSSRWCLARLLNLYGGFEHTLGVKGCRFSSGGRPPPSHPLCLPPQHSSVSTQVPAQVPVRGGDKTSGKSKLLYLTTKVSGTGREGLSTPPNPFFKA